MSRNMQMPESFFIDVLRLMDALLDYDLDEKHEDIRKRIEGQINAKIDAMKKRELYTKMKTADDETTRREAREKYLEKVGMSKDFRY